MAQHPYTIRLARPEEEDAAFAVERAVWAPYNWLAEGGIDAEYFRDMHLVAVDAHERVVANIDACPMEWDGEVAHLPAEGWRDVSIRATEGFDERPRYACALGASILKEARGGNLSTDLLLALRGTVLALGYEALLAPVRPSARASMPQLSIAEYARTRLPDGRHYDPWVRAHERVGGRIIGSTERSMYWWGEREQWEEWVRVRLPANGSVLIDGSTGWLELVEDYGELVEDSLWLLHSPNADA